MWCGVSGPDSSAVLGLATAVTTAPKHDGVDVGRKFLANRQLNRTAHYTNIRTEFESYQHQRKLYGALSRSGSQQNQPPGVNET